ncbi:probable G-protein coupled receptor 139 [Rhincodon typus]|uniref:probable G-protein coupled receptor 139 n=1 Tax=Rhincodon typus TaxID=259920 RepID=UPI00202F71A0|nr:probable G-protein coupled receptor 139 [Rhincodon typus]
MNRASSDILKIMFIGSAIYTEFNLDLISGKEFEYLFQFNLLAIVILSQGKCGLSSCTTCYLLAMAAADMLVISFDIILFRLCFYYFPRSFLEITPVCSIITVLLYAATDCSVWFTITFTCDRFVAVCCQKLKQKYCTEKMAVVILSTTCILLCLKDITLYFRFEPGEIIDNVPWFCKDKRSYYTDPGWIGFNWFETILTPLIPYGLILLLNALTVRHVLVASRVRKELKCQSKGENSSDPEMESRRKSLILLFTMSGNFIILWFVYVLNILYYKISGINPKNYSNSLYMFEQVGVMLLELSCCTNTFIYGMTQSKFRQKLKIMIKYPATVMFPISNTQNN